MAQIKPIQKVEVTPEEQYYRSTVLTNDYSKILNVDIRCTVCSRDINWMLLLKKQIMVHPVLDVLLCEGCLISVNTSNSNSSCLWCGLTQQESIYKCKKCSMKFCSSCIRLNFGLSVECWMQYVGDNWICFICLDGPDDEFLVDPRKESFLILRALCDSAQKMCEDMKKLDEKCSLLSSDLPECAICTSELETVSQLTCKHKFHKVCINEWMKKSRSCPICRASYIQNGES